MLHEEILKEEYIHLVSELARYDNEGGRIATLFSIFVVAALGIGVSEKFTEVFILIPFLILLALQTVSANHYAYSVREIYIATLEKLLREDKSGYPSFYGVWARKCYHGKGLWTKLFAPFNVNIHIFVFIAAVVIAYSWNRAKGILESNFPQAELIFSILVIMGCLFVMISWIWMNRQVATLMRTSSKKGQ